MKNILGIGILTCDISILGVEKLPRPGSALPVNRITMKCGGTASNCAMDIARLGLPVTLAGRIGSDSFGDVVKKELNQYAPLLIDHTVRDSDPLANTTTSCLCIGSNGERAILTSLGATFHFNKEDILPEDLEQCDICFVTGALLLNAFEPSQEASVLRRMQEAGKFTCMDTCYDTEEIWLPKIKEAIRYLDLFMPSYNEAVKLSGKTDPDEMADFFFDLGTRNVLIKLGSYGVYLCEQSGERTLIPSFKYRECVDTTGAGDSFCAGFISAFAKGASLKEAAMVGNMVGACCVSEIGGQAGLLSLEQTRELMKVCEKNNYTLEEVRKCLTI